MNYYKSNFITKFATIETFKFFFPVCGSVIDTRQFENDSEEICIAWFKIGNLMFAVQECANLCLNEVYWISIFKQHCSNKFKFFLHSKVRATKLCWHVAKDSLLNFAVI